MFSMMQQQTQTAAPTLSQPTGVVVKTPRRGWPSVTELSTRLYAAYTVEGGGVHLAGCTLEPQLVASIHGECRISGTGQGEAEGAPGSQTISRFVTAQGEVLDDETAGLLGLRDLVVAEKPPRLLPSELARCKEFARSVLARECRKAGGELVEDSIGEEMIWCRRAAGKLRFSIGGKSADLAFDDWAALLRPPPFVCPATESSTFHVAATDDGRIVAADEIARCEQSGRRVLRQELAPCSATGKMVAHDLVERCPVTMQPTLKEMMTPCPVCGQRVSPAGLVDRQCRTCRNATSVSKDDPRICLVLGECPGLDRWRNWRLVETSQSYVLEARGLLNRLLVVVEKETLKPTRVAERNRFQTQWSDVPSERWPEILE
jgi:hypothetical protein